MKKEPNHSAMKIYLNSSFAISLAVFSVGAGWCRGDTCPSCINLCFSFSISFLTIRVRKKKPQSAGGGGSQQKQVKIHEKKSGPGGLVKKKVSVPDEPHKSQVDAIKVYQNHHPVLQ